MFSSFIKEQKRYTREELCEKLDCSSSNITGLIRSLKSYGILKNVRAIDAQKDMSHLLEYDEEIVGPEIEGNEHLYVFSFVGVIVVGGRVLKCYPKYLLSNEEPIIELKQILKVLEKYNSKEKQIVRIYSDTDEGNSFNLLALQLFLFNDFYENGIYSKTEDVIETNGSGEILWDKTINETFTLLSNNRPYYMELQTKKRVSNEFDYFQRLHECILTKASKEMKTAGLLELFDITEVNLSNESIDDFGDKEYILYRIENELSVQFNTRKQLVLKALFAYIDHSGHLDDVDALSVFGTNSYSAVWESVCADIMDNKLKSTLGSLKLPLQLKGKYDKEQKLENIIEKPMWTITRTTATDTLRPDIISLSSKDFIIFDAKYYNPIFIENMSPKNQPGIESVIKQYMYQLAYQEFIEDQGFVSVKNCFLLPVEGDVAINTGEVFMNILNNVGLESIKVRQIPASQAYDYYLSGKKMDIECLDLDCSV